MYERDGWIESAEDLAFEIKKLRWEIERLCHYGFKRHGHHDLCHHHHEHEHEHGNANAPENEHGDEGNDTPEHRGDHSHECESHCGHEHEHEHAWLRDRIHELARELARERERARAREYGHLRSVIEHLSHKIEHICHHDSHCGGHGGGHPSAPPNPPYPPYPPYPPFPPFPPYPPYPPNSCAPACVPICTEKKKPCCHGETHKTETEQSTGSTSTQQPTTDSTTNENVGQTIYAPAGQSSSTDNSSYASLWQSMLDQKFRKQAASDSSEVGTTSAMSSNPKIY